MKTGNGTTSCRNRGVDVALAIPGPLVSSQHPLETEMGNESPTVDARVCRQALDEGIFGYADCGETWERYSVDLVRTEW